MYQIEGFKFQQVGMTLHSLYNIHTNVCILFPLVVLWSVDVGDDDKRGQSIS